MVNMVLGLLGVGPILKVWMWNLRIKLCALLQGNEMSLVLHSRNLISSICFRITKRVSVA